MTFVCGIDMTLDDVANLNMDPSEWCGWLNMVRCEVYIKDTLYWSRSPMISWVLSENKSGSVFKTVYCLGQHLRAAAILNIMGLK